LVAVHDASPDEAPLMDIGRLPMAIVDLLRGDVALAGKSKVNIHLPSEFAANGRRTGLLAERLLVHLNR
jgi:hypothetical protein